MPALHELETVFSEATVNPEFQNNFRGLLHDYVGRATPLTFAHRLTAHLGGPRIYLKREDLCHTGAHKINNTVGQILLARQMGKTRIIAETGAGQHGVATATVCAFFGMPCVVYMGKEDVARQNLNVLRMRLLGAEVIPVTSGSMTLKDATNEAIRDWVTNIEDTHYIIGSVVGPHPYPLMVRTFQSVIGDEVREQLQEVTGSDRPAALVACVGGGSNAIGMFHPFVSLEDVDMFGVEAAGEGLDGRHAATLTEGEPGILHGSLSYLLQDNDGQISEVHSISAGLDYPGVGPEHSYLKVSDRVEYLAVTDTEALEGVRLLSRMEGIIPALETSHAIAALPKICSRYSEDDTVVVCCSGRGDKDMATIGQHMDLG
ncbi:MAG: tryptophan synthase subunit beta [Rhodothermales bacterium]|nr:tryptophan synthase subunit beta [Rhodothermales bacterium]